jgi:hypothetical protein
MHFLCPWVVGSKLAQPLTQQKMPKLHILIGQRSVAVKLIMQIMTIDLNNNYVIDVNDGINANNVINSRGISIKI